MANSKISNMTLTSSVDLDDEFVVNQGSTSVKITLRKMLSLPSVAETYSYNTPDLSWSPFGSGPTYSYFRNSRIMSYASGQLTIAGEYLSTHTPLSSDHLSIVHASGSADADNNQFGLISLLAGSWAAPTKVALASCRKVVGSVRFQFSIWTSYNSSGATEVGEGYAFAPETAGGMGHWLGLGWDNSAGDLYAYHSYDGYTWLPMTTGGAAGGYTTTGVPLGYGFFSTPFSTSADKYQSSIKRVEIHSVTDASDPIFGF